MQNLQPVPTGIQGEHVNVNASGQIKVRSYGTSGLAVVVLHGGPGAAGGAAPIARRLASRFSVIEPWQRESGGEPLTVATHVADLHEVIRTQGSKSPPAIVGESWGAMLALAYAAAHPHDAGPLVLVGCGTFDLKARARLNTTIESRLDGNLRKQIDHLQSLPANGGDTLHQLYKLTEPIYCYDPDTTDEPGEIISFDERAHVETWNDMVRLQENDIYPAAFTAIVSPALMLHGAHDPHPGRMIYESLKPYIRQLEYREWERCGHKPWIERHVRDEFYAVLCAWLTKPRINGV